MNDMATQQSTTTAPQRKKRIWLRLLGFFLAGLLLFVIILYHYLTSAHFVRSFIFPAIEKNLEADIQADEIRIRPFSRIVLGNFSMTEKGETDRDPLLKFDRIVFSYKLMSFVKGKPYIESIEVLKPEVNFTVTPPPPEPPKQEVLLEEIRDLLKNK